MLQTRRYIYPLAAPTLGHTHSKGAVKERTQEPCGWGRILQLLGERRDEVRVQTPRTFQQRRFCDWFAYRQYLHVSILASLRKLILQHEAKCSEESLVLAPPGKEEETKKKYITSEREIWYRRWAYANRINIYSQAAKKDSQRGRHYELANNIREELVLCFVHWKQASGILFKLDL